MSLPERGIVPAVRHMKDFEKLLSSSCTHIILLDCHLNLLKSVVREAGKHGKQMLLHADLINGLKNDEYAAEFLCQVVRPAGLISTRTNVVARTKQNGLIAIQRLFLLDSGALEKSYALLEKNRPDYIEVLPGVIPHMIAEVRATTGIPVLAGGLIRSVDEVENALAAGAAGVTTSSKELWKHYMG